MGGEQRRPLWTVPRAVAAHPPLCARGARSLSTHARGEPGPVLGPEGLAQLLVRLWDDLEHPCLFKGVEQTCPTSPMGTPAQPLAPALICR